MLFKAKAQAAGYFAAVLDGALDKEATVMPVKVFRWITKHSFGGPLSAKFRKEQAAPSYSPGKPPPRDVDVVEVQYALCK